MKNSKNKNKIKNRNRLIIVGTLALLIILSAVFAAILAPNDPYQTSASSIRMAPCAAYPFGTDNLGRCVFSRVLYGGRTTIAATFILVFISFVIGTVLGMLCGYYGGILDMALMRLADIMLAFPQMVIAIAVAGILNAGMTGAMIALGITMWVSFARLSRSHTFSIKNEAYIEAARFAGKTDLYIIMVHVFPGLLGPVLTNTLTQIGTTMIGLSGLSFLGLGVIPPKAEWGSMISEARAYIQIAPWAVIFPSLATVITIIVFNYLGDVVMDYREA
ncbi:ABC transporter permease [Butyrivibrio sp. AE3004]|uniref:ABC transporter permease n=1 Tax=Butyrivibrio sp. AE3004 TaxID=1506994 RepID=UPI000494B7F4|nr:ABC transporter permease [Butyrivibrio sp. AE3004]